MQRESIFKSQKMQKENNRQTQNENMTHTCTTKTCQKNTDTTNKVYRCNMKTGQTRHRRDNKYMIIWQQNKNKSSRDAPLKRVKETSMQHETVSKNRGKIKHVENIHANWESVKQAFCFVWAWMQTNMYVVPTLRGHVRKKSLRFFMVHEVKNTRADRKHAL